MSGQKLTNLPNLVKGLLAAYDVTGVVVTAKQLMDRDIPKSTAYRAISLMRQMLVPPMGREQSHQRDQSLANGTGTDVAVIYNNNILIEERKKESICAKNRTNVRAKYTDEFSQFWDSWPRERRVNKAKAFKAFQKTIKHTPIENLLQAINEERGIDPRDAYQFTPHPERWLRDERFNDPVKSATIPPKSNGHVKGERASAMMQYLKQKGYEHGHA